MRQTSVTKHLCAAAYLDRGFRERALGHAFDDPYCTFGVSPGVDTELVLKHCLAARRRENRIDVVAAVILAVFVTLRFVVAEPQRSVASDEDAYRTFDGRVDPFASSAPDYNALSEASSRSSNAAGAILGFASLLALFGLFIGSEFTIRWGKKRERLRKPETDPSIRGYPTNAAQAEVFASLREWQQSPIVVYGGFSPFVGCGVNVGGWSAAINVSKSRSDTSFHRGTTPFELSDVYAAIDQSVDAAPLRGLERAAGAYIDGQDIREDKRFLPRHDARPRPPQPSLLDELQDANSETIRRYSRLQVTSWDGDLSFSYFIRFATAGGFLFAEASYFMLPPIRDSYRVLDRHFAMSEFMKIAAKAAFLAVFAGIVVAVRMSQRLSRFLARTSQGRRARTEVLHNPSYNYGAKETLRELASQQTFRRYFQKVDGEMFRKVLDKQVLDAMLTFLESHGVDTSEFAQQQSVILNHGIIMSGGSFTASAVAVGAEAQAKSPEPRPSSIRLADLSQRLKASA